MTDRTVTVAACSPDTTNVGGEEHNDATVAVLKGEETDPGRIRAHAERFLTHQLGLLERAGQAGIDVAIIPEDALRLGSSLIAHHGEEKFCRRGVERAEKLYHEGVAETCRRHQMCVVGGTMVHRAGRYYNMAFMHDASGDVIAEYAKTHLPKGEAQYTTPGDELPVVDTPFGRAGFLICWDIIFPETYAVLALKGAEIVFQPTFGHWEEEHDVTARSRVIDWSVPLAISMWGGCSGIIGADGTFLARTGRTGGSLAIAPVDLEAQHEVGFMEDARREKTRWRRPELYGEIASPRSK